MSSPKSIPARIVAFLSSFGLATSVLVLLLIITFLGTLEQAEHGLVASQARYFESAFIDRIDIGACMRALAIKDLGDFKLPLMFFPGGYTLMAVLFVNMFLGGIIRIRKAPRTIGVIISHFAILFMIASGAVTYHFAKEGTMNLAEGQTSDEFQSFHERAVEIEKVNPSAAKDAARTALVIGDTEYRDLSPGKGRTFTHESLPFDLMISNWRPNAEPKRDVDGTRADAVEGYFIQQMSLLDESGQAIADEALFSACLVTAKDKKTGVEQKGILWEAAAAPWTLAIGADKYLISLVHRSYKLPFAIRLDKTDQEEHPGTTRARKFTSMITKLHDGHELKRVVTMNEPVRGEGYAVFQQTFDDGSKRDGVKRSGFQIVENPSDHWPLISCIIVGIGLLIHFSMALARAMKWNEWATAAYAVGTMVTAFGAAYYKLW